MEQVNQKKWFIEIKIILQRNAGWMIKSDHKKVKSNVGSKEVLAQILIPKQ